MGKTTSSAKGTVSTVLGEALNTPIEFEYSWDTFDSPESVREAGEWPNDKEILDYVNGRAERNALSGARAKAIAGEVERIKDTPEYKRREFINACVAYGMSREQAEALAASKL